MDSWPCVHGGLAVQVGFLLPREVTFVISHAQPVAQSFCQPGLNLKGLMPDQQLPSPQPLQSRPVHHPLALQGLYIKELTLAFEQGQAKSSCQSQNLEAEVEGFDFMLETEVNIIGIRNNAEISHCITNRALSDYIKHSIQFFCLCFFFLLHISAISCRDADSTVSQRVNHCGWQ